jgi:hypothetical protein
MQSIFSPQIIYRITKKLKDKNSGQILKSVEENLEIPYICEKNIHFKNSEIPKSWTDNIPYDKLSCLNSTVSDDENISKNKIGGN